MHMWLPLFSVLAVFQLPVTSLPVELDGQIVSINSSSSSSNQSSENQGDNWRGKGVSGFCLSANQACLIGLERENLLREFNETFNTIGCAERCDQEEACQHWTWWGDLQQCQLFSSCVDWSDDCCDCQTGPRSCGLWNNSVAAISGGLSSEPVPNSSTVTLVGSGRVCNSSLQLPRSRWGHVSSVIGNNYYVCGGTTDLAGYIAPNNTCDVYDTVTRQWTTGEPMLTDRHHATAVEMFGRMFVLGGLGYAKDRLDQPALSSMEVFEPVSHLWSMVKGLKVGLYGHCATAVRDGIVVTGGVTGSGQMVNTTSLYNVTTNTWTRLKDLAQPRSFHACSAYATNPSAGLWGHEVTVTGGKVMDQTLGSTQTTTTELYSFSLKKWRKGEELPHPIAYHSQVNLGVTRIFGGNSEGKITDQILELEDKWEISNIRLKLAVRSGSVTYFPGDLLNC